MLLKNWKSVYPYFVFLVSLVVLTQPLLAGPVQLDRLERVERVYVDASAPAGGDGSDWGRAFRDLQDAIEHARLLGGEVDVWVAEGVYTPDGGTGDRHAVFDVSSFHAFTMLGGFPEGGGTLEQRAPGVYRTVLSGDLLGDDEVRYEAMVFDEELLPLNLSVAGVRHEHRTDNAYGVVSVRDTPGGVVFDGVEIRGGHALGIDTPQGPSNADGGGVRVEDVQVVLRDCVISGNSARAYGGGVYAVGADAGLVLEGTLVEFNSSQERGGGIYTTCQVVRVLGSDVVANTSLLGGGQYSSNAIVEVIGSSYEGNIATGEGGGYNGGSYGGVQARDTVFAANVSFTYGGGVRVQRVSSVLDCRFEDNVALERGGGLYLANTGSDDEWGFVVGTNFHRNACGDEGGGAFVYGDVEIIGAVFEENRSLEGAGGLRLTNGGKLGESIFRFNTARVWGGGLNASTRVDVRDVLFEGNHAEDRGGAVFASNNCSFSGLQVNENSSVIAGGGVYLQSDCSITRSAFRLNSSSEFGGGLAVVHDNQLSLLVIDSNSADVSGGGVYAYGTLNTLHQVTCIQNNAQDIGGIVGLFELEIRDSILWDNVDSGGVDEEAQIGGVMHDVAGALIQELSIYMGNGNIDGDPMFVDPLGPDQVGGTGDENLRLTSDSPAIDAGSHSGISSNLGPFDFDGSARYVGFGGDVVRVIDIGAYEAQDCDADAITDAQAIELGLAQDCNGDGVPDACQLDSYGFVNQELLDHQDPVPSQRFGSSLAADAGLLAVGAPHDSEMGAVSGSVYLYDTSTGSSLRKLTLDQIGVSFRFGESVAVSDGLVAVGAPGSSVVHTREGALFVFDSGTGEQLGRVVPDDARPYDSFGYGVAMGDGYIAVGSSRGVQLSSGKVRVYEAQTLGLLYEIDFPDAQRDDEIGRQMAIDGGRLYIGYDRDSSDEFFAGSVLVYRLSDGAFLSRVVPDEPLIHARFGAALDVRDDYLAVGAYGLGNQGQGSGGVYIFDTASGNQLGFILPDDVSIGDSFGYDVVIGDGVLVSGAISGAGGHGAVYIHSLPDAGLISKLTDPDGVYYAGYGAALEESDGRVFVANMAWRADSENAGDVLSVDPVVIDEDMDGVPDVCVCLPDLNHDGALNFFDVSAFLVAYQGNEPSADINGDGLLNFFDVSAFLIAYQAGCP